MTNTPLPSAATDHSTHMHADCEVLVIGAGPAGSACAKALAQAGVTVWLADAQEFPREKTCGDALIPDALNALEQLGLRDKVLSLSHEVDHARCLGPGGGHVDVPGRMAVLPRRELDDVLRLAAMEAGAHWLSPWKLASFSEAEGRVSGAVLRQGERELHVHARWTVLATGASAGPLVQSGLCERRQASFMGLRGHVRLLGLSPGELVGTGLQFIWHRRLQGGYGWIFPLGDGVFNIGVGLDDSHMHPQRMGQSLQKRNLRDLYQAFCDIHPLAARLHREGQWLSELKGAPMRTNLDGARWHRPGLLLAGEAAGSTFAFTGEGIGKALETGIATAQALLTGRDSANREEPTDAAILQAHHAAYTALLPRYRTYRIATQFNRWPWLIDLLIWKSRRSAYITQRLSDILHERRMPGSLLSWRGVKTLLFK